MSTTRAWLRDRLAGWPLRRRLVALMLALVAAGLLVAGGTATAALRGYLYDEVDRGLADALAHAATEPVRTSPSGDLLVPMKPGPVGAQLAYIQVLDASGQPVGGPDPSGFITDPPVLPTPTAAQASALQGEPYIVGSQSGASRWRAMTIALPGGAGSVTVAADIAGIDATVQRLVLLESAIGFLVLLVVGIAGWYLVRRSLRPLDGVETAAAAIAAGDLAQRAPTSDPRTEVGSLAASFNTMADAVQESFAAQQASEQAARESAAEAQASEARMRQFIADASHELRTPLTSVRGFAELYRIGAVPSGAQLDEAMGRIESEAGRMGVLVEDLLLLARLDQQRPLDRVPVDVLALAADAVAAARATAPGREVRLESAGGDPPVVVGDEVRLRQVADNLLSNALRYSPQDEPVVVRVSAPGAGVARLEVVDRGPGMDAGQAARAFERFYRADQSRSRADGGTGLGLAIVAAITTAHGGQVGVVTAPGSGSTFWVDLPLAAHQASAGIQARTPSRADGERTAPSTV